MTREIVIKFSFGDLRYLWDTVRVATAERSWRVVRTSLRHMRWTRRQGHWKPYTLGQYMRLRQIRRVGAGTWPHDHQPFWRHAAGQETHDVN